MTTGTKARRTAATAGGADTSELRALLENEIAQAEELAASVWHEREELASETIFDIQVGEESGEGAGTHVDRDRDLALYHQAMAKVEESRQALARLDAGTFGTCDVCGDAIAPERLMAVPSTTTCVHCKSGGLQARLRRR